MHLNRSPYLRALLLVCIVLLALPGIPATGSPDQAVRPTGVAASSEAFRGFDDAPVSLVSTETAVPPTGSLDRTAIVRLEEPTDYLEVRLRVRRPSGRLLYQKTFVDSDVEAGPWSVRFFRQLADLDLKPDAYPMELTVRADGDPVREWTVKSNLRVYDPKDAPLGVAFIVKVSSPPLTDPAGRFVTDPGLETAGRDQVVALADAVIADTRLSASLAVAPATLIEWRQAAAGYELATSGGVAQVPASASVPAAYARALDRLSDALASGRLELLDVPYADPSLAGLESAGRPQDLSTHLDRGFSAYYAALETSPSAGMFAADAALTNAFAERAAGSEVAYAVVSPACARQKEESATPGVHMPEASPLSLLVPDTELAEAAASDDPERYADVLFSHANSDARPGAVPLAIEVGPGYADSVTDSLAGIQGSVGAAWVSYLTAAAAAARATRSDVSLLDDLPDDPGAPADLYPGIASSRAYSDALSQALPAGDPEADDVVTDSLIAQSASWAGADDRWVLADRARGFASSAERRSRATLDRVSITAEDITLSGVAGEVPFSVRNGTDKTLSVIIRATGPAVKAAFKKEQPLAPGETYIRVPVDLRQSIESELTLDVVSAGLTIATQKVTVRASYLDRLATIGAVVLLLLGILFYISRRVRRAEKHGEEH